MSKLVERLFLEPDFIDEIRKKRTVNLDYILKFKGRRYSYIEINCGEFSLRVNSFGVLNSSSAYDVLMENAKELRDCFCRNVSFRAFYCGREYKNFNPQ